LHFQLHHPQGKLVSVSRGEVFDVAVDIRVNSPTYGKWCGVRLNDSNHRQIYIPPNFAHGYIVLSDVADFLYKCTDYYHPEDEKGLLWNDPALAINWEIENPQLSEKDKNSKTLAQLKEANQLPVYRENK